MRPFDHWEADVVAAAQPLAAEPIGSPAALLVPKRRQADDRQPALQAQAGEVGERPLRSPVAVRVQHTAAHIEAAHRRRGGGSTPPVRASTEVGVGG